jgi:hypothetical protein
MNMKSTIAAIGLAFSIAGGTALAGPVHPYALKMSGRQFLSLCANPPPTNGPQVAAMCQMYVAGVADALRVSGQACFAPGVSEQQLFAASAWWIESRARQDWPVSVMVTNGIAHAFPCRAPSYRSANVTTANQKIDTLDKFFRALLDANAVMALFGAA